MEKFYGNNNSENKLTLEMFREMMRKLKTKEETEKNQAGHFMFVDVDTLIEEDMEMWKIVKDQSHKESLPVFNEYKRKISQENKSRLHYAGYLGTLIQYKIFGIGS